MTVIRILFHIHLQNTVSLYSYDHAKPSLILSVVSHILRPALSHHQGNNPRITRRLYICIIHVLVNYYS